MAQTTRPFGGSAKSPAPFCIEAAVSKFTHWCYVIEGFLQTAGSRTRLIDCWQQLHGALCDDEHSIQLRTWKADWAAEAELLDRLSVKDPTVVLIGYSWGAGWGAMQMAKHLDKRGVRVTRALLIDPVYRHRYWLGNWRAFVPWIPIRVPANVDHVTWWRQKRNLPRAHPLVGGVKIDAAQLVDCDHQHMDDAHIVVEACRHHALKEMAA